MKRIGPELKMPKLKRSELKVPPFVSDFYYDLHDRHLLPLVALILVAIIATPFLLKDDPAQLEPVPSPRGGGVGTAQASAQTLTVVKSQPGLRNYKKRLARRRPSNPFHQHFTAPVLKGSELNKTTATTSTTSTGATGASTETGLTATTQPPVTNGGASGEKDSNGNGVPDGVSLYTYVLDLQITQIRTKPDGTVEKTGPKLHKDVKAPTPLPGGKAPVITYLGLGAKEPREPMFLVSSGVTAVYGEGKCISGTGSCELITLQRGFPVTFVYGEDDVRYKVNLLDVTPVPVDPPQP